jgi:hypothetical protein
MNPRELYKLLTKYHLVRETECKIGDGELYVFHPMDKVYEGAVVGYGLYGMPIVSFAREVKFTVSDGVPFVTCFGWDEPITEDKYENKLATLEKQYHQAVEDYKKYLVKQRLNKMNVDFK